MHKRALLTTALLCIGLLAAAGLGAAATQDEVQINETNDSIYIETAPCEGHFCWLSTESYDLYINGDHEESLAHGETLLIDETMYENDTVEVAVAKKQFYGDTGWAYHVERNYPEEQASNEERGNSSRNGQGNDRGNRGNESAKSDSPPEVVYNTTYDDRFDDCISKANLRLVTADPTEEEYCFEKTF